MVNGIWLRHVVAEPPLQMLVTLFGIKVIFASDVLDSLPYPALDVDEQDGLQQSQIIYILPFPIGHPNTSFIFSPIVLILYYKSNISFISVLPPIPTILI